ncbi:RICIN domain-containing protein, partial [uncultured Senegalimassilia sp.]|uniref:RICIN domain-containing protein n=1 Tax=uncultured Senegalimassilia sp. TaxID=1714350 RepID=UPI0026378017
MGSFAYAAEPAPSDGVTQTEASQQAETKTLLAREQAQVDASHGETASAAVSDTKKVVPGADAPTSPTNASTHINTSAEQLLSSDELSAAYSKLMARSAWDYSSATFADVLVYAEQYIGLPYVWGGKDLYRDGGFDCSGFVNWVYNNVCGLNINSDYTNAASLYYNYCVPVSESDARPGDIVFWKGTYQSLGYISHVGIYCGNGIAIDAGDPIGYDRVTDITNMNGAPAERVYGRLVTLSSTSATLDSDVTKIRVSDQAYTGSACTPKPTVVNAGSVLNEGSDYWVSYENNMSVGTATVVVHGIGKFAGQEARKTFSIYTDIFSAGSFVISSAVDGSQVLDVPGASKDAGTAVQLYERNSSDAQTFEFEKTDDGFYAIKNTRSGLYLTLYTTWAELRNTTAVTQQGYYGGLSQKWCIKPAGNDQYVISSAMDCAMVLDVSGGVARNGSVVQSYSDNGTAAQRWSFSPAKTARQRV